MKFAIQYLSSRHWSLSLIYFWDTIYCFGIAFCFFFFKYIYSRRINFVQFLIYNKCMHSSYLLLIHNIPVPPGNNTIIKKMQRKFKNNNNKTTPLSRSLLLPLLLLIVSCVLLLLQPSTRKMCGALRSEIWDSHKNFPSPPLFYLPYRYGTV